MNGAEALLKTLIDAGVEVCFANPGTSEMHMVAAMDRIDGMRPILVLFEGVASGAADGYGRMADKPAATLLHLGPGLSNSMANQHNARRAHSPIVNLIGDHATYHLEFDAPLSADIVGQANTVCDWVKVNASAGTLAEDVAEAIAAAQTGAGQVTALVVPANCAWEEAPGTAAALPVPACAKVEDATLNSVAELLKGGANNALLLGGKSLREDALHAAGRIAAATGARIIAETFPTRWQRGEGRYTPERLPYLAEMAIDTLKDVENLVLVGAKAPVAFFAYPNVPSVLTPEKCEVVKLATVDDDLSDALLRLAEAVDAPAEIELQAREQHDAPAEKLCPMGVATVINDLMPENTIISEEAATSSMMFYPFTNGARKHEVMTLTGGSIGQGLPVALGAAVACPDQKVLCLHGDGGAMYTVQSLWTAVRENLDITFVIYNNSSYAILNLEFMRVGAEGNGEKALSLLDLNNPGINWVDIAKGQGMKATRAETVAEFSEQFAAAMEQTGPVLIEAMVEPLNFG